MVIDTNADNPTIRPDKGTVSELVIRFVPEYLKLLEDCRDQIAWRKLSERFAEICKRINIENYVLLYEDERRISAACLNAFLSDEDQTEWIAAMNAASLEEQQKVFREFGRPGGTAEQVTDAIFPEDEASRQEQVEAFKQLPDDSKEEAKRRWQYLVCFALAWLHNALAVMVHGERMTSLVPKALAGDKDAFAKAIHIDKSVLLNHPGFNEIHHKAMREADKPFLDKITRRLASPVTQGRIQLAGVFLVFSLLESMNCLDDSRHAEILDICDAAGLDRWQNRIEDENAVTKALIKYRRYQKTGGVSMH